MNRPPRDENVLALALLAVVGLAIAWWKRATFRAWLPGSSSPPPSSSSSSPSSSTPSGLGARLIAALTELLPNEPSGADQGSILTLGDPRWDAVLGGRKPDYLGGPTWRYYATYAGQNPDGSKRSGGTTCGVVLGYELAKAGAPVAWINRAPDEPAAPGSGFQFGAPQISKALEGARKDGYLIRDPVDMQDGDAYWIDHPERPNADHVGVVKRVGPRRADGTREVLTGDGGQTCPQGQCARYQSRILSADGRTLTLNGVSARVRGVVREPARVAA